MLTTDEQVQVVQLADTPKGQEFVKCAEFDHPYPPTKLMWLPDPVRSGSSPSASCSR